MHGGWWCTEEENGTGNINRLSTYRTVQPEQIGDKPDWSGEFGLGGNVTEKGSEKSADKWESRMTARPRPFPLKRAPLYRCTKRERERERYI